MIQTVALVIALTGATWLAFAGLVCAFWPDRFLAQLGRMGGSWKIQIGEHAMRGMAGGALVIRADYSKAPEMFNVGGWFIMLSSVAILILPRQWHHAYARWWADRLPTGLLRVLAIPTFAAAGLLAYAAI